MNRRPPSSPLFPYTTLFRSELETAARFLAGKYREFGLKPADGKNYLQSFPVTTDAKLGPRNRFNFSENGHATALANARDYTPISFSSTGKFSGTVVFEIGRAS